MSEQVVMSFGAISKTITVNDGTIAMIESSFATAYKWPAEIDDPDNPGETILNPETKMDLVFSKVREFILGTVKAEQKKAAAKTAGDAVADAVDAINDSAVVS